MGALQAQAPSVPTARVSSAVFSPCGQFRYRLERQLERPCFDGRTLTVVMVNPSTADAEKDDATIRKVKGFAERAGYGRVVVGNLFAYRSTDIKGLATVADPRGEHNNAYLSKMIYEADALLFAWGPVAKVPKKFRTRWTTIAKLAREAGRTPLCLGVCNDGHPRHPLMVAYAQPLVPWKAPR